MSQMPAAEELNLSMKNMEFCFKWVHMARYELILRLDGALWLTIIFKPLLTPKRAITIQFDSYLRMFVTEKVSMTWNVTFINIKIHVTQNVGTVWISRQKTLAAMWCLFIPFF